VNDLGLNVLGKPDGVSERQGVPAYQRCRIEIGSLNCGLHMADGTMEELLEQYEATGADEIYLKAKRLYEEALRSAPDTGMLVQYGYLLECHARHTLRQAVAQYERAIELDPAGDQAHYQLIGAYAGLREPERAIAQYEQKFAAAAADVRQHRLLARAYLAGYQYADAMAVAEAGLRLAQDDPVLIEFRGMARAGNGDVDGALADWRQALVLNPENISAAYSSAFLLERQGRLEEAIEQWGFIMEWCELRGHSLTAYWPKREVERLRGERPRPAANARR
jgi:tetratricopeptide (TPR) repeat protein